jgi:hypothetical protein
MWLLDGFKVQGMMWDSAYTLGGYVDFFLHKYGYQISIWSSVSIPMPGRLYKLRDCIYRILTNHIAYSSCRVLISHSLQAYTDSHGNLSLEASLALWKCQASSGPCWLSDLYLHLLTTWCVLFIRPSSAICFLVNTLICLEFRELLSHLRRPESSYVCPESTRIR